MDTQLNEMVEKWVAARHQEIPEGTLLGWAVRQVAVTCQGRGRRSSKSIATENVGVRVLEEARIAARALALRPPGSPPPRRPRRRMSRP